MNTDFLDAEADLASKLTIDNHTNAREELQIEATLEEWINFMQEKNINGVLSIYMENAVNYDLMAPLQYQGLDTIQERLEKWFATFESDIVLDIEEMRIRAERDIGFAHCLIRYMGDKKEKKQGEDMYNRVTFCFEKLGNDWLISHQHSSLPFSMDNGKVLLDLKPEHH